MGTTCDAEGRRASEPQVEEEAADGGEPQHAGGGVVGVGVERPHVVVRVARLRDVREQTAQEAKPSLCRDKTIRNLRR
jgi:hypothetical protein